MVAAMKTTSKIQAHSKDTNTKPSRNKVIKPESSKRPAKASRENPAPEELAKLIALVNQVPDGLTHFDQLKKLAEIGVIEREPFAKNGVAATLDALIFQAAENLPDDTKALLGSPPDMSDTKSRLSWMTSGRSQLRYRYEYLTEGRATIAVLADGQSKQIGPFRFETWAYKDEEGRLRLDPHPILRCIEGVEVDRVRRCPVCEKFFWAGHRNKKQCSDACGHALRNRRYRKNYSEKYKLQRVKKENEAEKKGK